VLLALAFFHVFTGGVMILAYVVGTLAIITGMVRFCPAWAIFGINTRETKTVGTAAPHAK
jgi:Inner membrane protein YgaP-like, transmembrane domain